MRRAPLILAAFFVFVTLSRVAHFSAHMGDQRLSLAFALALGAVIFAASYWTQYKGNANPSTQERAALVAAHRFAWLVLLLATLIDGSFNLADVLSANPPGFFVIAYGLAPTVLSLLLGILQARIDALPELRRGSNYQINRAARRALARLLDRWQPETTATPPEPRPEGAAEQPETPATPPEPRPELPEGYPHAGSSREKAAALLTVDPALTGSTLAHWLKISPSRARALKREIIGSNGNGSRAHEH